MNTPPEESKQKVSYLAMTHCITDEAVAICHFFARKNVELRKLDNTYSTKEKKP